MSQGEILIRAAEPEDTNVVDLMAALRASLKGSGAEARRGARTAKQPAASEKGKRATPRRRAV